MFEKILKVIACTIYILGSVGVFLGAFAAMLMVIATVIEIVFM